VTSGEKEQNRRQKHYHRGHREKKDSTEEKEGECGSQ
jgi:hypothetical protein